MMSWNCFNIILGSESEFQMNQDCSLWQLLKLAQGDTGFPGILAGKESACNEGDLGLTPGFARSPGEKKGYPLQYSGRENSTDCTDHGIAKSWTRLSDIHEGDIGAHFPLPF